MAERRSSSKGVTMASPLYSAGVHHAEVHSPVAGTDTPDPMGFLSSSPTEASFLTAGGGDDVSDWHEEFPDDGKGF